jgi:hypothetical protein
LATKEIQYELLHSNDTQIAHAHYGSVVVSVYAGQEILHSGLVQSTIQEVINKLEQGVFQLGGTTVVQLCGSNRPSEFTFGLIIDTTGDSSALASVQKAVKSWASAQCVANLPFSAPFGDSAFYYLDSPDWSTETPTPSSDPPHGELKRLKERATSPTPEATARTPIVAPNNVQGSKGVFAHFMVNNVQAWNVTAWENEIALAQASKLDAFALNIAWNQGSDPQVQNAFTAAANKKFQLFLSFDYAGNGPWDAANVTATIKKYAAMTPYYHYNNKPLVSTFEGPANANDWKTIKSATGCFFMPDWSSLGAQAAMKLGVADGLFSWAAWPWGNTDSDDYTDASYLQFLGGAPYMMPVSPWFYTNLPGFGKNWMWRGDDLWFDRWMEVSFPDTSTQTL